MHEQGLAIDFTWNGSVISSHSSPAFQWLAAHAGRYGLYNLPSEPWHWSVNGN
jgi:D-alanyl-D-alanine carboxypeptidase